MNSIKFKKIKALNKWSARCNQDEMFEIFSSNSRSHHSSIWISNKAKSKQEAEDELMLKLLQGQVLVHDTLHISLATQALANHMDRLISIKYTA